jgi:orotidine-5'-phosphate decarboxylase
VANLTAGPSPVVTPIVALDVADRAAAETLVTTLGPACEFYKVGLELFSAEGPAMVSWLRSAGKRVFVDLKLHDIPNTVRGAARSVARAGASLLTVHAVGGEAMIAAAVAGAAEGGAEGGEATGCGILAVTVLTSLDGATVGATWGRPPVDVTTEVVRLAGAAVSGGAAGVVCSGHELAALRGAYGERLGYLVPGLRLAGGAAHDQQRVMTPGAAAAAGATWLVLGRAVTAAPDPVAALQAVQGDVALALGSQVA